MTKYFLTLLSLLVWSCGGATPAPATEPSPSLEATEPADIQESPQPEMDEPIEEPVEVGPASLTINVTVNREPSTAQIKLFRDNDEPVAEGNSGEKMRIQSGSYSAHIQITDSKAMIDRPTKIQDFTLEKGADVTEQVTFAWAKVRLNVKVNGKLNKNAKIDLIKDGTVVATVKSAAAQFVTISPGRYQAEVKAGKSVTKVDDVMFPEGATIDVPINVTF